MLKTLSSTQFCLIYANLLLKTYMLHLEGLLRKYGRGWEGAAPKFDAPRRGCLRVSAASELFFFFFCTDSASIFAEPG